MVSYELSCYKRCLSNLLDIRSWCLELRLLCLEAVHLNYVLIYSWTNILCYSIRIEIDLSWLYCRQTHSFYHKFVIGPWNSVFFNGLKSMVSFLMSFTDLYFEGRFIGNSCFLSLPLNFKNRKCAGSTRFQLDVLRTLKVYCKRKETVISFPFHCKFPFESRFCNFSGVVGANFFLKRNTIFVCVSVTSL